MKISERLKELQMTLPEVPKAGGVYEPVRMFGANLAYLSGMGCNCEGGKVFQGKVGCDIGAEEAEEAARQCVLNSLAVMEKNLGSLDRIKKIVKVLGFVASSDDFYGQPQVMNAASSLLCQIFGDEAGKGARSAIGVNVLPGNIPVEVEMMVELNEEGEGR